MQIKDIELKYKINAYRVTEEYPTERDILFDMLMFIQSTRKRKKNWAVEDFKMEFSDLEKAVPLFSIEEKKELIKKLVYNLFDKALITYEGSTMGFNKQAIEMFYKI